MTATLTGARTPALTHLTAGAEPDRTADTPEPSEPAAVLPRRILAACQPTPGPAPPTWGELLAAELRVTDASVVAVAS